VVVLGLREACSRVMSRAFSATRVIAAGMKTANLRSSPLMKTAFEVVGTQEPALDVEVTGDVSHKES
jgi:hypothetical protein